jgi:hypothetical protein
MVKKIVILVLAAAGAVVASRKLQESKAERTQWSDATDRLS